MGLEMTAYTVSEDDGSVEVCARVTSPPDDQPLPREFVLRASTLGLTASEQYVCTCVHLQVSSMCHSVYMCLVYM